MLKILNTGMDIKNIDMLINQHYDPDLCSSIPHLEAIIEKDDLAILSHKERVKNITGDKIFFRWKEK